MLPKHPDDSWHQGIDLGPALLAPFPLHPSFGPFPLDFDSFSARSPHSAARWLSIPVSFPSQPESRKNLERITEESRKNPYRSWQSCWYFSSIFGCCLSWGGGWASRLSCRPLSCFSLSLLLSFPVKCFIWNSLFFLSPFSIDEKCRFISLFRQVTPVHSFISL